VGKKEEAFVRALVAGRALREAASGVGLSEDRARRFLESVARFAGAVGSVPEFATGPDGAPKPEGGQPTGRRSRRAGSAPCELVVHTDGASLGNPGPAGAGGVIATPEGDVVEEFHEHIGRATNNVAEYEAVRIGLTRALAHGARRVLVRLDSELVANQLAGRFKIKDRKLVDAYLRVERVLSEFDDVRFEAIPREENSRADRLAQMGARSSGAGR
jgi:ribonuclease HI